MVIVDISESKKMERALHQNEVELYATLQSLSEGVLMLDSTSSVRMCNTQAEKILGLNASQIIEQTPVEFGWRIVYEDGRPIDEVFPSRNAKRSSTLSPIEAVINVSAEQSDTTIGLHKAPGAMRWINIQSRPLSLYGNSELPGTIIVLTDITERRLLVQALRECERQKQVLEHDHDQSLSPMSTHKDSANKDNVAAFPSTGAPLKEADVSKTDYITISSATQGNIMLDARKDVLYLEGADDYTLFITNVGKEYLTFGTLGKWEQRLFSQGFIRIHRSTIVNFHAIYSWHYENKNIVLNMRDGKQIRVSKSYKAYFLSYVR
jgi:DNA-binding LytR/AlgR family response regulator